jgi:hypothetical protein
MRGLSKINLQACGCVIRAVSTSQSSYKVGHLNFHLFLGRLNEGFEEICQVQADLSGMHAALVKSTGPDGDYYDLSYSVALRFGGTELLAFVEWEQNVSFDIYACSFPNPSNTSNRGRPERLPPPYCLVD